MNWFKSAGLAFGIIALTACNMAGGGQSFPGRAQVQLMSADGVTTRTYACLPGQTTRQTQARAARAHRYVDGAIQSAYSRLASQSGGGFGAGLGVQAELNAETARISREAEAEYRCQLVSSRAPNALFG